MKQHFKEFEERAKARKASLDVLQKEMEKGSPHKVPEGKPGQF